MYNLLLFLLGLSYLPKLKKYARLWPSKMGRDFDAIEKSAPLVWIHAVSMGETKAVIKFVELFQKKHPHAEFLVTSITETGHAEAKRSLPFAKHHCLLPFDFSWIIRPIVKRLKPDLVVLSETDYWYHFLTSAKKHGASIAVINGKLSERSMKRYKWLGPLVKSFFAPVDLFCVQTNEYKKRLEQLEIPSEKIFVTGNLKFDAPPETLASDEMASLKNKLHIKPEDFVLVAGSTHETEEALILHAFQKLLPRYPQMKILFVPRHPERFCRVEALIAETKLPYAKWSTLTQASGEEKVFLIDTMGFLKKCYQIGTLAIMGGSFVSHVGGHNVLEPAFYGVPVLFGPHMHTQTELMDLLLGADAGVQVTHENLLQEVEDLLQNKERMAAYSAKGKGLTQGLQGTSQRTLEVLEKNLSLTSFSVAEKPCIG